MSLHMINKEHKVKVATGSGRAPSLPMREKDAPSQEMVRLLLSHCFDPLEQLILYGLAAEPLCDKQSNRVLDCHGTRKKTLLMSLP